MKKIAFISIIGIAIIGNIIFSVNNAENNSFLTLSGLLLINNANAESTSCYTTCDGGRRIEVNNCQFCESYYAISVTCYDTNNNICDEKFCASLPPIS